MAIDTDLKKLSLLNFGLPFYTCLPYGSIDENAQKHLLHLYAGLGNVLIDGDLTKVINRDYGDLVLYFNGGEYYTIGEPEPDSHGVTVASLRVSGNITLGPNHYDIKADTDSGDITVTLPAGLQGTEYRIGNVGGSGNKVIITPNGVELLLGSNTSFNLYDGETLIIIYDSTEGWT